MSVFRPVNHPLFDVDTSSECGIHAVSLPAYPGDYFDCENCAYSWTPSQDQVRQMWQGDVGCRSSPNSQVTRQ